MGKVATSFSMSLDGFVAGPGENVDLLFKWMSSGDTELTVPMGHRNLELKVPAQSVHVFTEPQASTGALVAGRHLYEITGG